MVRAALRRESRFNPAPSVSRSALLPISMLPRILIIEDSHAYQRIFAKHLDGMGTFAMANSCKEALALVAREKFDLVISDFLLPDGDAKEVIIELRKTYKPDQVPVIVVTSLYDKYLARELYTIGVNFSMPKVLGHEFRAAIQDILTTRKVVMPTSSVQAITVFSWHTRDRHYCYSPQARHLSEGESEEAALNHMKEWIRVHLRSGFEATSGVKENILYL